MKMDGKNREEQENGAKVRDLEEYKAENRKRKRRRRITVGILAGAILAAGIGTGVWLQLRTFQGYDIVQATETEDTDTYMFQKSGNKIVRYGIDGIELRDRKNQTLWSDHYTMENPQMISCGDAIAIYDKNGTKIVVYDADGKAGEITASYPIVKASVAGQGVVAAILENNGESWIKYYNTDGTEIASSHPNMDSPGYPYKICTSGNDRSSAVNKENGGTNGKEKTQLGRLSEKENKKRPIRCAYCHTFGAACNCMCRSWCSGMGMPAPSDASTCAARSGIIDESTCGIRNMEGNRGGCGWCSCTKQ